MQSGSQHNETEQCEQAVLVFVRCLLGQTTSNRDEPKQK